RLVASRNLSRQYAEDDQPPEPPSDVYAKPARRPVTTAIAAATPRQRGCRHKRRLDALDLHRAAIDGLAFDKNGPGRKPPAATRQSRISKSRANHLQRRSV